MASTITLNVDETIPESVFQSFLTQAETDSNWTFVKTVPGPNDGEGRIESQTIADEVWFRASYDHIRIPELHRVPKFFGSATAALGFAFTSSLNPRYHDSVKRGISSVRIPVTAPLSSLPSSPSRSDGFCALRQRLNPPLVSERECVVSRRWRFNQSESRFFGLELSMDLNCTVFPKRRGTVRALQHRAIWVTKMSGEQDLYNYRCLIHFTLGGWVPKFMATKLLMMRFDHMWKEVDQAVGFEPAVDDDEVGDSAASEE